MIDNTPPSSAIVTAPAAGAFAGGTVTLAGNAADSASGVGQMVFKINGTVVGTTSGSPASLDWDSTSIPDGPATVTLEAMDVAGNGPTVSAGRTFVVDNNPPAVTLDTPGAASSGTVVLSTTTSSDTIQVTFERSPAGAANWSTIAVDNTAPFSASFDTSLLADGLYDLRALASDGSTAGASNVRTTRIDNTLPTGSITTPIAGATVGGTSVTLAASACGQRLRRLHRAVPRRRRPSGDGLVDSVDDRLGRDHDAKRDAHDRRDRHRRRRQLVHDARRADHRRRNTAQRDARRSGHTALRHGHAVGRIPDADTARVSFQVSPAGAATWTTVANDETPPTPYSGAFDSTTVADGVYDLRAIALRRFRQRLRTECRCLPAHR